jgi:hypothetical protein
MPLGNAYHLIALWSPVESDVMGVLKSAILIHSDSERVDGDNIAPQTKSLLSHTSLSVVRTSEAAASECRRISQQKGFTCLQSTVH